MPLKEALRLRLGFGQGQFNDIFSMILVTGRGDGEAHT